MFCDTGQWARADLQPPGEYIHARSTFWFFIWGEPLFLSSTLLNLATSGVTLSQLLSLSVSCFPWFYGDNFISLPRIATADTKNQDYFTGIKQQYSR